MLTPIVVLPEMTLAAPAAVPPIVLPEEFWTSTPMLLASAATGRARADQVALDQIARRRHARAVDVDAQIGVARDQVARTEARAADGVARRVDRDSAAAVGQRSGARDIGANPVPHDEVAGRGGAPDADADAGVARNQVSRADRRAADGITGGVFSSTPIFVFGIAAVPAAFVPTKLPAISSPVWVAPTISTPTTLPEIRLPAPAAVPPTVLPGVWMSTPPALGIAAVPAAFVPIDSPRSGCSSSPGPLRSGRRFPSCPR